jgi:hypothetical protein
MTNKLFSLTSPQIDREFGLEIDRIEEVLWRRAKALRPEGNLSNLSHVLHDGHQTWVGLEPQVLNTPYEELLQICEVLRPEEGQHFVDLGAGYGRLGLVLNLLYPEVTFTGYELVPERVDEGNQVFLKEKCHKAKLITQDLTASDFVLPKADFYFLYDYGKVHHIRQTLSDLEKLAMAGKFKVIARGQGSRSIIEHEHPWLSQIYPVYRAEHFSIYSI